MSYLLFIPLMPLLGGVIISILYILGLKYNMKSEKFFGKIALIGPFISAVLGIKLFLDTDANEAVTHVVFEWMRVDELALNLGFYVDSLSSLMVLFVTFIGFLIHLYSTKYMSKDKGYGKFFAYMNLFLGSMLILVLADNPALMFVGWEGVGACSYLLIAFYYGDSENVKAGNKAFIMNRVGDFGFVVGMMILFFAVGVFGFDFASLKANAHLIPIELVYIITFALFIGATGKSAQLPLYTWLPDAMAGPTPVSALIHAATMVTAGIYMVARFSFLYSSVPAIGEMIAYIGAFTALVAAIIALRQNDIKKILAYSTVSQLGYMFVAVGVGAYSTGLFHVFTHAFFKALLFLGAGAVIYALHHEQNIWKMGNLKKLKIVYIPMLIATLAISGIPPFAGFFSKDEVLLYTFASGHTGLYIILLFTACLTAYYMFRLFFVVFHGKDESFTHKHIEKPPFEMSIVLQILMLGAIFAGFLGLPEIFGGDNEFAVWLQASLTYPVNMPHVSHATELKLMFFGVLSSSIGIFIAYKKFYRYGEQKSSLFMKFIERKLFVDELYSVVFVKTTKHFSRFLWEFIDNIVINKIVDYSSYSFAFFSKRVGSFIQNGYIRFYLVYMIIAISLMAMFLEKFV